jgi:prepilin-type N-terminal cleavage/methylation domain-containing protein
MKNYLKKKSHILDSTLHQQNGFTLMEIVVATTIFVIVFMALLSLFNYTLKINRRTEALRQASQDMRDFVEFLAKEIRNGQIDYYVSSGQTYLPQITLSSPCGPPGTAGSQVTSTGGLSTYGLEENKLGIINTDNVEECFYFGDNSGNYVNAPGACSSGSCTFSAPASSNYTLVLQKSGVNGVQILNPPNFRIDKLMFIIRPLCDPYTVKPPGCVDYGNARPRIQPFVSMFIQGTVQLPTGEQVPIYYQTSIGTNQYDIPNP